MDVVIPINTILAGIVVAFLIYYSLSDK